MAALRGTKGKTSRKAQGFCPPSLLPGMGVGGTGLESRVCPMVLQSLRIQVPENGSAFSFCLAHPEGCLPEAPGVCVIRLWDQPSPHLLSGCQRQVMRGRVALLSTFFPGTQFDTLLCLVAPLLLSVPNSPLFPFRPPASLLPASPHPLICVWAVSLSPTPAPFNGICTHFHGG